MGRPSLHPPTSRHLLDVQIAHNGYNNLSVPSSQKHRQRPPVIEPLYLTPSDESTRTQLQRQRLKEQHATAVVTKSIPGFQTSAAFFASLRTNLRLHASPPPSPISTPPSMRSSATSLPPPSPLSQAVDSVMGDQLEAENPPSEDPLAGVPELRTFKTDNEDDQIAALKLTADSVAQMRQAANRSLIWHPFNLAVGVAILALVARYIHERKHDKYLTGTTCAGIIMAFLTAFRYLTKDYLFRAETINFDWLGDADVLVTKFGDEVIGTVVVDWLSGESRTKRKKAWRGEIRAWTVRMKYRRKGVGSAVLEEAVREARRKGAESLEFAYDHANALRVLPGLYNKAFDQRERRACDLLQDLLAVSPVRGKRK